MAKLTVYGSRNFSSASGAGKSCNVGVSNLSIGTYTGGTTQVGDTYTSTRSAGSYSNYYVRVVTNDRTGVGTATFQIAQADANQAISITANSGALEFEDTSHTDTPNIGDLVDMAMFSGTGGTTFSFAGWGVCFKAAVNTDINYGAFNNAIGVASQTSFFRLTAPVSVATTETAICQCKSRIAGTMQNGFMGLPGNDTRTTPTTFGNRWSGGVGGFGTISVSVPGSSTAGQFFEDTSHTDVMSVGDFINRYATSGSGSGGCAGLFHLNILTTDNSMMQIADCVSTTSTTYAAGVTRYEPVCGNISGTTSTESQVQVKVGVAATGSQYEVFASSNGTTTSPTTLQFRKNPISGGGTVNGNGLISIAAGAADGWQEDTSHSDVLVWGDEINWQIVVNGGGTTLTLSTLTTKMVSALTPVVMLGTDLNGLGSAAGSFYQNPIG